MYVQDSSFVCVCVCVTEQGTANIFFSGVIECFLRLQVMLMISFACVFMVQVPLPPPHLVWAPVKLTYIFMSTI